MCPKHNNPNNKDHMYIDNRTVLVAANKSETCDKHDEEDWHVQAVRELDS